MNIVSPIIDDESWQADRINRAEPDDLTRSFHSAVPVLEFLDWRVVDTGRGYAKTVLPLNVHGSNRHITHQAAVMLIAADYTGGIALGTILNGVPLVGIHAQETEYGAYLWGARVENKWIRPSIDDLVCTATISRDRHRFIKERFFGGRRVLETVLVQMWNNADLIAEANFTYWVQDTEALRRNAFDEDKIHHLFDHRTKSSARLIAGLRAIEQDKPEDERLFRDAFAGAIAGRHGRLLAERFSRIAPQLQPMVAARTRHLDDALGTAHDGSPIQVVNIGSGFDVRFCRIPMPPGSRFFNLDLPHMLKQRRALLREIGLVPENAHDVPIDLTEHDMAEALLGLRSFDPEAPTFLIWEGGSMYFSPERAKKILSSARRLLRNPGSRLWMDYVDPELLRDSAGLDGVGAFMNAMRSLGEPFINGIGDIGHFMGELGLRVSSDTGSGLYQHRPEGVYDLYRFCVASGS